MHEKRLEELPLNVIVPNRFQPRIHFDDEKIESLAKSIIRYGVLEPIIVRPINGKFEIIAGERRFKASKIAGKSTIPAVIVEYNDKESIELALLENVQRQELTAIEEAIAYRRILDMGYITQEELAKKTGKSQPTIANKMRLLMLDDETQEALINHKISERHARSLLKLVGTGKELEMLNRIIKERLTVRDTDNEIAIILGKKAVPKRDKINMEKTDSFFVTGNEAINDVDVNAKKIDNGPVFIAKPEIKEEKSKENMGFDEIEKILNENDIKKEEEGEYMDIEKIMQEAQDINAEEKPKNMNDFINTPSPYDTILGPSTSPEQPVVNNQNILEDHNKFINVVPPVETESKIEEPQNNVSQSTVTFDSVFNSVFDTPTTSNDSIIPQIEEVAVTNNIEENAMPVIPDQSVTLEVNPEIQSTEMNTVPNQLVNEPVIESIPVPNIETNGFPIPTVQTLAAEEPQLEIQNTEIPEFTSTIAESAPNFENSNTSMQPEPVVAPYVQPVSSQSFDSIESLMPYAEPLMVEPDVLETAPKAEEAPIYEVPSSNIETINPFISKC
mgnify:CR=1 FL=1